MKENIMLWLAGIGGAAGLGIALFAIKKFGPTLLHKFLGGAIQKAMDLDEGDAVINEARKRMILAQMVYLELRIPDRGKGDEKRAALVASLGPKAAPMAEELMAQLDDELKKLTQKPA